MAKVYLIKDTTDVMAELAAAVQKDARDTARSEGKKFEIPTLLFAEVMADVTCLMEAFSENDEKAFKHILKEIAKDCEKYDEVKEREAELIAKAKEETAGIMELLHRIFGEDEEESDGQEAKYALYSIATDKKIAEADNKKDIKSALYKKASKGSTWKKYVIKENLGGKSLKPYYFGCKKDWDAF